MKIASIHLQQFRRFKNLKIQNIPPAKLIILTGSNGSGKSALFDGMAQWESLRVGRIPPPNTPHYITDQYYTHDRGSSFLPTGIMTHPHPALSDEQLGKLIDVRSAYRLNHEIHPHSMLFQPTPTQDTPIDRLVQQDGALSRNYIKFNLNMIDKIYNLQNNNISIGEIFNIESSQISAALNRVFKGNLELDSVGNPNTDRTFFFKKGPKEGLPYVQLSAGEKSAFDLLLDLYMKVKSFKHTVYCIDEPESHMNTALQGALLTELFDLIPDETQMWIATHSIGMMRKAKDLYE
jgi:energy-coupling factor transporter ATP-binding protein EcfA2